MDKDEREMLIEAIGINATDSISNIQDHIRALHEYLGVVQVFGTKGFTLQPNVERKNSIANPVDVG